MKEKLDLQSVDGVSANIEKIAALFPNCITETAEGKKIDFDLLKQELSAEMVEGNKERYRLEWPGKREAIVTANLPTTNTLRPVREDSVDFDTTENIYIEGDNLEVLKLLQESYLNKIKMIYIDPPYNTGKDFVYKDNFAKSSEEELEESGQKNEYNQRLVANPETSGRYHSDWLSMMYPRLKLARNLLTEDGVIFISIDDNEVHNLRKICDEIFGEGNFVGEWQWFKSATPPNLSYKIKKNIEFILAYEKQRSTNKYKGVKKDSKSDDPITKPQNSLKTLKFPKNSINFKTESGILKAGIYGTEKFPNKLINDVEIENFKNKDEACFENRFIWVQEKLLEELSNNTIVNCSKSGVLSYKKQNYSEEVPPNLIDISVGVETTEEAGKDLLKTFGTKVFDYPKPVSLLQYLLRFNESVNSDDIILDFFSGSATTAHAVMQLNAEDTSKGSVPGKRKYIMVQLPEATDEKSEAYKAGYKNICEIGKERIRRAAASITNEEITNYESKKAQLEKLINAKLRITKSITNDQLGITKEELSFPEGVIIDEKAEEMLQEIRNLQFVIHNSERGFRVYRLDSSNMQEVYYRPQDYKQGNLDLFADNVKPDRSAEDLVTQIMLDWGLELSLPIEQKTIAGKEVFAVAGNSLYCCFDKEIDEAFAKAVAKDQPLRIVFRDNGFTNDTAKENVKQLLKQLSSGTEMKVI
ncbi:MAG TPA: site-specific DNA-methyltransferase [Edaphocola sp.]|nr:site-specific DNA-methyltransferase [Edaphocola sp.]